MPMEISPALVNKGTCPFLPCMDNLIYMGITLKIIGISGVLGYIQSHWHNEG